MIAVHTDRTPESPRDLRPPVRFALEPPEIQRLAQSILTSTETPQSLDEAERGRFPNRLDGPTFEGLQRLQKLLQDPEQIERLANASGIDLCAYSRPPRPATPTGDFYDLVRHGDDRVSIFIGDACGHDTPDAWANAVAFNLFVRTERFLSRGYSVGQNAVDVLKYIDDNCNFRGPGAQDFVTASHILIDPKTGAFQYANAFNTYPIVILRASGEIETVLLHGGPLANPELPFEYKSGSPELAHGKLNPGDVLLQFTDGVQDGIHTSGVNMEAALPGIFARIQSAKIKEPGRVVDALLRELKYTHDDIAVVAFRL